MWITKKEHDKAIEERNAALAALDDALGELKRMQGVLQEQDDQVDLLLAENNELSNRLEEERAARAEDRRVIGVLWSELANERIRANGR